MGNPQLIIHNNSKILNSLGGSRRPVSLDVCSSVTLELKTIERDDWPPRGCVYGKGQQPQHSSMGDCRGELMKSPKLTLPRHNG